MIIISTAAMTETAAAQDGPLSDISQYVLHDLPEIISERLPGDILDDLKHKSNFSVNLDAGFSLNDNVAINELDLMSGNGDVAAKFSAKARYKQGLGDYTKIDLSYRFSQTLYEDFTEFDLQSQLITARLERDAGKQKYGVNYSRAKSDLGGDDFLNLDQISPFTSRFISKKAYIRGTYSYTRKEIDDVEDRDADTHKVSADVYYFLDGLRQYFILGYAYGDENADADPFDYNLNQGRAKFIQKLDAFGKTLEISAAWRYEDRDYNNITPSISAVRRDKRHRGIFTVNLPLTQNVYGLVKYEYSDFSSNLPSSDFNRNVVSLSIGAEF